MEGQPMGEGFDRLAARRGIDGQVYEPAEDSWLLATVVLEEITAEDLVIDVGTGSGFVARRIADAVGATVIGTDINPHACRQAADAGVPTIRTAVLSAIADDVADVVVCNPPYLPAEPSVDRDDWLSVAVVGGQTGRAVVDRLLADFDRVLGENGRGYVLVSSHMDIEAVCTTALEHGFVAREIARDDSFPDEVLVVLRIERRAGDR